MPADLAAGTRMRAVTSMAAALVSSQVNGIVTSLELGSGSSRRIAIAVAPSKDISVRDALKSTKDAIEQMGPWFGSGLYEHAKNRAIFRFAASLEHSSERDLMLVQELASNGNLRPLIDDALATVLEGRGEAKDRAVLRVLVQA